MPDDLLQLTVRVNADTGQLELVSSGLNKAGKSAKEVDDSFLGLGKQTKDLLKIFGIAFGVGEILNFFKDAVKHAEAEAEAFRKLKFNVEALGISFDDNKESLKAWASTIQSTTKFNEVQATESLQRFMLVTNNLTEAQNAAKLAMDLSSASGKDLAFVQEILFDLINGNERSIKRARDEFGRFIEITDSTQTAVNKLIDRYSGASEKTESFTKTTTIFRNELGELADFIGEKLIAIIENYTDKLTPPSSARIGLAQITQQIEDMGKAGYEVTEDLIDLQNQYKKLVALEEETANKKSKISTKSTKDEAKEIDERLKKVSESAKKETKEWEEYWKDRRKDETDISKDIADAKIKEDDRIRESQEKVAMELVQGFSKACADSIMGAKNFGDAMESIFKNIINMIIQATIQMTIFKTIATAIGGPFAGFLPFGGKAGGGRVEAGGTYVVGEEGPEVLKLGASGGEIVPNNKISKTRQVGILEGSGSGDTHVYVNLSVDKLDISKSDAIINALADAIAQKTAGARKLARNLSKLQNQNSGLAT